MPQTLPRRKIYRYCLADIAKGLFNGMIGNYLLNFFQPTTASVLTIGAGNGASVGLQGVRFTGIYAGVFSLLSLVFFLLYQDTAVTQAIENHGKQGGSQ